MALVDYKISQVIKDDSGIVKSIKARFYSGDISNLPETDDDGNTRNVRRYRRNSMLMERVFVPNKVMTEEEIRHSLNAILKAMFPSDTPIKEERDVKSAVTIE